MYFIDLLFKTAKILFSRFQFYLALQLIIIILHYFLLLKQFIGKLVRDVAIWISYLDLRILNLYSSHACFAGRKFFFANQYNLGHKSLIAKKLYIVKDEYLKLSKMHSFFNIFSAYNKNTRT